MTCGWFRETAQRAGRSAGDSSARRFPPFALVRHRPQAVECAVVSRRGILSAERIVRKPLENQGGANEGFGHAAPWAVRHTLLPQRPAKIKFLMVSAAQRQGAKGSRNRRAAASRGRSTGLRRFIDRIRGAALRQARRPNPSPAALKSRRKLPLALRALRESGASARPPGLAASVGQAR